MVLRRMMLFAAALFTVAAAAKLPRLPEPAALKAQAVKGLLTGDVHIKVLGDDKAIIAKVTELAATMGCAKSPPQRIFQHAGKHEAEHVEAGLHRWYRVSCSSRRSPVEKSEDSRMAMERLRTKEAEDFKIGRASTLEEVMVHPGYAVRLHYQPDDPLLDGQTHYGAINLYEAWDLVGGGNPEIVVQVVDTGIDIQNPDFVAGHNLWENPGETDCTDGVDNDDNGYVDDCNGFNHADFTGTNLLGAGSHGSHCAGTIGAATDNGEGVAGVGSGLQGNRGTQLMTNVAFGASGENRGFSDGIVYGADNGARISSNSWGYSGPDVIDADVIEAIDYAIGKGVIVVFAAGNDNDDGDWYPAFYDPVIAVAATEDNGERASFSNFGDWIDIAAPGVDILSTFTVADGSYGRYSGTSMACPHVAGLLALGWGIQPDFTPAEVLNCFYGTATDIDDVNSASYAGKLGAGLINAEAFVSCMLSGAPTLNPTISQEPTLEPTTAAPSISPLPTPFGCGSCDIPLEVTVLTDSYPREVTWTLRMIDTDDDAVCRSDSSTNVGPFDGEFTEYTQLIETLCEDREYEFVISDLVGDGICCGYGDGSYSLVLDGREIRTGGEYLASDTYRFSTDPLAPTPQPTVMTIAPTSACASTCYGESCDYWVAEGGYTCADLEATYDCDCSLCSLCEDEVVCASDEVVTSMQLYDSYGDGWSGNYFEVKADSTGTVVGDGTLATGYSGSRSFCLKSDECYSLSVYDTGNFTWEVSWGLGDMTGGAPSQVTFGIKDGLPSHATVCEEDSDDSNKKKSSSKKKKEKCKNKKKKKKKCKKKDKKKKKKKN